MKAIIGFVGEKGAGKETVITMLSRRIGIKKVRHEQFSSILFETLTAWNLPATRTNLQKLAVVMNEGYGDGTLAAAVRHRLGVVAEDIVMLEGIRWDSDVALVRSFPKSMLVYVTAPAKLRYERTKRRGHKAGEKDATLEQFMREEQAPNEVHIARIGSDAEATIINDGSIEDLKKKIDDLLVRHVTPLVS